MKGLRESSLTRQLQQAQETKTQPFQPAERADSLSLASICYRLYTEDKPNLGALVSEMFPGFSIFHVDGYYQHEIEKGAVIEILAPYSDRSRITALAGSIARENHQAVVLVTLQLPRGFDSYSVYGERK